MSAGKACTVASHQEQWRVLVRNGNHSVFNGGRFTPSEYSSLNCPVCHVAWRTKAAYVAQIPDA